jgi:hypothetical protein
MASAKFSAFEFASEEFNSELALLVNGFTQNLVRIIQEECVRKGNDTDGENSTNSSPFASPTSEGKAPRKRAPASKRGRPSKEDTDVVIDPVSDMLSASEELLTRAESVRSSSKSPRSPDMTPECMESVAVSLDDLMNTPAETTEPAKKGKGKAEKVPKEKKEKAPKAEKVPKEKVPKEKKEKAEKVPKEKKEKVEKVPKAEKAVKVPKEKKEKAEKVTKGKKGKKEDDTPPVEETLVEDDANPTTTILPEPENVIVEEDDDDVTSETVASSSTHSAELSKLMALANVLATAELDEENDYAKTQILDKIEGIINSQGSQDDEIASQHGTLVEDMDNEINIDDEFSENGDDKDDDDDETPPPVDDDEL